MKINKKGLKRTSKKIAVFLPNERIIGWNTDQLEFQLSYKLTDFAYRIGTIQGKYQPDGILGYIGDDYILEFLGGQSTFRFSVPQNGDLITDASLTQSSLGTAAKQ